MSATAHGEDMSLEVFRAALELARTHDSHVALGGGEPTLHPQFELMLVEAMAASADLDGNVFIVTNGSIKRRALLLAKLKKADVVDAWLSQDEYHDPIDEEVIEAFTKLNAIRDVTKGGTRDPQPVGRAIELLGWEPTDRDETYCACDDWLVKPNGDVMQCGCDDSPSIGNVFDGIEVLACGVCHLSIEFLDAYEELGV